MPSIFQRMSRRLSFRVRIVLLLLVVIMLPLSIMGTVTSELMESELKKNINDLLVETGTSRAQLMDDFMVRRHQEAELVSGSSTLRRGSVEDAAYGLGRYSDTFEEFDSLFFADDQGALVAFAGSPLSTRGDGNIEQRVNEWTQQARQGRHVIDRMTPASGNFDRYLVFVAKVEHEGDHYGWVFGQLNSERLASFAIDVEIGETGRATLFNSEGRLVGHRDKSRYGYDMGDYPIMTPPLEDRRNHPGGEFVSGDGRTKWGMTLMLEQTTRELGLPLGIIVDQTVRELYSPIRILNITLWVLWGVALIFAAGVLLFTHRAIGRVQLLVRSVQEKGNELTQAARSMTQMSNETGASVEAEKEEISQVAVAMNQMSSTVREVAQSTQRAADRAQHVVEQAKQSNGLSEESVQAIEQLSEQIRRSSEVIDELHQDTHLITDILETIRGISEQTNLLSLNAAIEAARAGEHGRGFAVVAGEVRALARRTHTATEEIQRIVAKLRDASEKSVSDMQSSQQLAEKSVEKSHESEAALQEILSGMEDINQTNAHVATAAEEQSAAVDQVNQSVQRTSGMADNNAQRTEEMQQYIEQLKALAETLDSDIRKVDI